MSPEAETYVQVVEELKRESQRARVLEAKLAAMTGERDGEREIAQQWENKADDLEVRLTAMTAARDELAALAMRAGTCDPEICCCGDRIAELRAVGKEQP